MKRARWAVALVLALLLTVSLAGMQAYAEDETMPEGTAESGQLVEEVEGDSEDAEDEGIEVLEQDDAGLNLEPDESGAETAEPPAKAQDEGSAKGEEAPLADTKAYSAEKPQALKAGNSDKYSWLEFDIYYYAPDISDSKLSSAYVALYQVKDDGTEKLYNVRKISPNGGDGARQWETVDGNQNGKVVWSFGSYLDSYRFRAICEWWDLPKTDAEGNAVTYVAYLSNADGTHDGQRNNVAPEGYAVTYYYNGQIFGNVLHDYATVAYNEIEITVDKTWTRRPSFTPQPPIVKSPRPGANTLTSDPSPSHIAFDPMAYLQLDPDDVLEVDKLPDPETLTATLVLYQNNVKYKTITAKPVEKLPNGNLRATVSFGNVPVADAQGDVYSYDVREQSDDGCTFHIDTYNRANNNIRECGGLGNQHNSGTSITYDPSTKSWRLNVVAMNVPYVPTLRLFLDKVWLVPEGDAPEQVTLKLMANGKDTKLEYVLADENNWHVIIDNLPARLVDGTPIKYTVVETEGGEGYASISSSNQMDGAAEVVLANFHPVSATAEKVWNDSDDADGKRPDEVEVQLQWKLATGDGTFKLGNQTIDLSSVVSDSWKDVPNNEELLKAFKAAGAQYPTEVVDLTVYGALETSSFKLNEENGWTVTVNDLLPGFCAVWDNQGDYPKLEYRFVEVGTVDDYETDEATETVEGEDGSKAYKTKITNTYIPPEEPDEPTDPDKPSKPDKPTDPDEPTEPSKPTKPSKPAKPAKSKLPKTGDMASVTPLLLLGAGIATTAVGAARKKRTK